jgi:uncharacterized membrane protein YraQ (UPF0718 family)
VKVYTTSDLQTAFWLGPPLVGLMCIIAGIVIWLMPDILAYLLAALLISVGLSLVVSGLFGRRKGAVQYRRMDQTDDVGRM